MRRHSTDLVGLLFGVTFAFAGVGFLVREATDTSVDWAWVIGLGLMLLGAIALIATIARAPRHDHDVSYAYTAHPEYAAQPEYTAQPDWQPSTEAQATEAQATEAQATETQATETQPAAPAAEEPTSED